MLPKDAFISFICSNIIYQTPGRVVIHVRNPPWEMMYAKLSRIKDVQEVRRQGSKLWFMVSGYKCFASYGSANYCTEMSARPWLSGTLITMEGPEGTEFDNAVDQVRSVADSATREYLGD